MQRLDKYGLITLVFLLVTFVAVVVWGEGHADKLKGLLVKSDGAESGQLLSEAPTAQRSRPARESAARPEASTRQAARMRPAGKSSATLRQPPLADARRRGGPASARRELPANRQRPSAKRPRPGAERLASKTEPAASGGGSRDARDARPRPEKELPSRRQPSLEKYVVQPGDTLSEIAQAQLGSSRRWREIAELNPGVTATELHVGQRLELPPLDATSPAPSPAPSKRNERRAEAASGTYVVQAGDTLSGIALAKLGSAQRWRAILELNPGLTPEELHVGQEIRLPDGARSGEPQRTLIASAKKSTPRRRSNVQ